MTDDKTPTCAHCGGLVEIRNPSGGCDHLYWPDNLTDEAKLANGYKPHQTIVWIKTGVTTEEMLDFLSGNTRQ